MKKLILMFGLFAIIFSCGKENDTTEKTVEQLLGDQTTLERIKQKKEGLTTSTIEGENGVDGIQARAKAEVKLPTGCDCELKVNSISGDWSLWSISQNFDCSGGSLIPVFGYDFDPCATGVDDPIGVWLPFNCEHPHFPDVSHNTLFFSSLYDNGDDCTTFITNIISGDPCNFPEYFAPTTASISIRCLNPTNGEYGEYNTRTFSLSSNVGDPNEVCAEFGNTGSDTFILNSFCMFRRQ